LNFRSRTAGTLLLIWLMCVLPASFPAISADPVSELSVQTNTNIIRAGSNNTIQMQISGIGKLLSNLDVSLTLPSPLVLFGDNHWRRSSFGPGDSMAIVLMIFAPVSSAGNSYQATLAAQYKEAGETTYSEESHTIGLLVRGWIEIVIYDIMVDPPLVAPGSAVTISGSLLNTGITAAMFTNLTVKPQSPLMVGLEGVSYMGQIDPNAPSPFSLTAQVSPSANDGKYDAVLVVYYQDDLHMNQQIETHFSIEVSSTATQTGTTTSPRGELALLIDYGQYLVGLIVLIVVVFALRRIRKRRPS